VEVPDGDPAPAACRACDGSGKRGVGKLALRFLYVAGLPLLLALDIALIFVTPDRWDLRQYLYGLAVILGLLVLVLWEELLIPCIVRFVELVQGLVSKEARYCRACNGSGRAPPVRPLRPWVKVFLLGCVVLVVLVLALCWLVAKGHIPI
jgi:hypothetical protein